MIKKRIDQAEIQALWNLAEIDAASPGQRNALVHCAIWQALDRESWETFKVTYSKSPASHQMTVIARNARRLFDAAALQDFEGRRPEFVKWVERVAEYRQLPSFLKRTSKAKTEPQSNAQRALGAVVESRFYSYSRWLSQFTDRSFSPNIVLARSVAERTINPLSMVSAQDRVEIDGEALSLVREYLGGAVSESESILGIDIQETQLNTGSRDLAEQGLLPGHREPSQPASIQARSQPERFQSVLELAALDFFTLGELGHIYCGHWGLRDARLLAGEPLQPIELEALDFNSDLFAATAILNLALTKGIALFSSEDMAFVGAPFGEICGPNTNAVALAIFSAFSFISLEIDTQWSVTLGRNARIRTAERTGAIAYAFISVLSKKAESIDQSAGFVLRLMRSAREIFSAFSQDVSVPPVLGDDMLDRNRILIAAIEDLAPDLRFFERGRSLQFDLKRAA